jgi:electron transport complex protein RnfG
MKSKIMPPLVLTVICIVVCGLLVIAHNASHADKTGVVTPEMKKGCEEIFGKGDYSMLMKQDGHEKEPVTFGVKQVDSVIVDKAKKRCLFELTCDGYAKGGLHLLIGINDNGSIEGMHFLSVGETPGLGAKAAEKDYTDKFKGLSVESDIDGVDDLTAATYSSKGLKKACELALETYSVHKGEIFA